MFPLSLANELFLIETYNRQQAEIEHLQNDIKMQFEEIKQLKYK